MRGFRAPGASDGRVSVVIVRVISRLAGSGTAAGERWPARSFRQSTATAAGLPATRGGLTLPTVAPMGGERAAVDRHPAARFRETLSRLPSYVRLIRALLGDRRLGRFRKAGLGAGLAYLASPIDLVPGIVPVLGQLDDLLVVLLAIRFALRGLPGPAADTLLGSVGLSRELLARDLDNVRATGRWAVGAAGRVGAEVAATGGRGAARAARFGLRAARTGLRTVRRRSSRT